MSLPVRGEKRTGVSSGRLGVDGLRVRTTGKGRGLHWLRIDARDEEHLALRRCGVDSFVDTVAALSPSFSGVLVTGVAAPRCFVLAERLRNVTALPVLVDSDGLAVAATAALVNALALSDRRIVRARVVVWGSDAATFAVSELLATQFGADVVVVDRGRVSELVATGDGRSRLAAITNRGRGRGPREAFAGADALVDLSRPGKDLHAGVDDPPPVVFELGRSPSLGELEELGTPAILATPSTGGVTSPVAIPGLLQGLLQTKLARLEMAALAGAARTIAGLVAPTSTCLVPSALDRQVVAAVAASVVAHGAEPDAGRNSAPVPATAADRAGRVTEFEESERP